MDSRLGKLINEYLAAVRAAASLLVEAGIALPESARAWCVNGIPGTGVLRGGISYCKHGYGCEVRLESGSVDFDFGREGEIDGFDVWRLADFAADRLDSFGFTSRDELDAVFADAVSGGEISASGYILHYVAAPTD